MTTWKLKRVVQCKKCPWRVDVDPHDIPNGYSETKHRALETTIARPECGLMTPTPAMAAASGCADDPAGRCAVGDRAATRERGSWVESPNG